jgi:hypothetical protein
MLPTLPPAVVEKIRSLRNARKDAIAKHEYERAHKLEQDIEAVKVDATQEAIASVRETFRASVTAYLDRYAESEKRVRSDAKQSELNVRIAYHKTFETLQATHRTKLLDCEKEYRYNRDHEMLRRLPMVEKKLAQSEKAAAQSQYEVAIRLRDESKAIGEEDVRKRLAEIDRKFEKERENLYEAFGVEIKALSDRFVSDLEKERIQKESRVEKEEAARDSQLVALVQKAQGKLAQVGGKSGGRELEGDMQRILEERGYPMPASASLVHSPSAGLAPSSPEKKVSSPKSKKSKAPE